jgi:hypothetical protein
MRRANDGSALGVLQALNPLLQVRHPLGEAVGPGSFKLVGHLKRGLGRRFRAVASGQQEGGRGEEGASHGVQD